jgi:hypothetical protein
LQYHFVVYKNLKPEKHVFSKRTKWTWIATWKIGHLVRNYGNKTLNHTNTAKCASSVLKSKNRPIKETVRCFSCKLSISFLYFKAFMHIFSTILQNQHSMRNKQYQLDFCNSIFLIIFIRTCLNFKFLLTV